MSQVTFNLEALAQNLAAIDARMRQFGLSWTVVTKSLSGNQRVLAALRDLGVRSMADSRLNNLDTIRKSCPENETWYIRPTSLDAASSVVALADVCLISEIDTAHALDRAAAKLGKKQRIFPMFELGDLREGLQPGEILDFFDATTQLKNLKIVGIGGQLGCIAGVAPRQDHVNQLRLYQKLLEDRYNTKLPWLSVGSSIFLPLLDDVPTSANHFRIGESLFLGTDLINGGTLPWLRDDVVTFSAEIVELKEKSRVPLGLTVDAAPFEDEQGQFAGQKRPSSQRALLSVGHLDANVHGLNPLQEGVDIAGASSDITVVELPADHHYKLGDKLHFRPDYGAFARLMAAPYPNITFHLGGLEHSTGLQRTLVERVF